MAQVQFQAARDGGVMTRWEGKVAFPQRGGPQPQAGETWEVEYSGKNGNGNVVFLRCIREIVPETYEEKQARLAAEEAAKQAMQIAAHVARVQKNGVPTRLVVGTTNVLSEEGSCYCMIPLHMKLPSSGLYHGWVMNNGESVAIGDAISSSEEEIQTITASIKAAMEARTEARYQALQSEERAKYFGLLYKEFEPLFQPILEELGVRSGSLPRPQWARGYFPEFLGELPSIDDALAWVRQEAEKIASSQAIQARLKTLKGWVIDVSIPLSPNRRLGDGRWRAAPADGVYPIDDVVTLTIISAENALIDGKEYHLSPLINEGDETLLRVMSSWADPEYTHFSESEDGYRPAGSIRNSNRKTHYEDVLVLRLLEAAS